jgi:hypothetical protein
VAFPPRGSTQISIIDTGKDARDVYFLLGRPGTPDGDTTVGATGDVGATAARTCFGFFASLLPRWPLDMIVPSLCDA